MAIEKLKHIRQELGLDLLTAAQNIDISKSYLHMIESGQRNATYRIAKKLIEYYRTTARLKILTLQLFIQEQANDQIAKICEGEK